MTREAMSSAMPGELALHLVKRLAALHLDLGLRAALDLVRVRTASSMIPVDIAFALSVAVLMTRSASARALAILPS